MNILAGIKIIEIEGIGPAPFASMHLADLGADVVRIARPVSFDNNDDVYMRGKRVVTMNLKEPAEQQRLLTLIRHADGLIEGMRPGVMERLGLGPDVCFEVNPKLAYGRVTGWGQNGPLAHVAGHDLNYIAMSGALWYSGQPNTAPFAPPTLIGDIAGGALYLTIGMLATLLNAQRTGKGDVIDAAIIDGSAHMMNLLLSLAPKGLLNMQRGKSLLDGSHWYDSYECACGNYITIGSLEPKFYAILLQFLGLTDDPNFADQLDASKWPIQKQRITTIIKTKTRDEWRDMMEGTDVCFSPVLNPMEAAQHPHINARNIYSKYKGNLETQAAPRFSHYSNERQRQSAKVTDIESILDSWA